MKKTPKAPKPLKLPKEPPRVRGARTDGMKGDTEPPRSGQPGSAGGYNYPINRIPIVRYIKP